MDKKIINPETKIVKPSILFTIPELKAILSQFKNLVSKSEVQFKQGLEQLNKYAEFCKETVEIFTEFTDMLQKCTHTTKNISLKN